MENLPADVDFMILGAKGMQGKIVIRDLFEKGYTIVASGKNEKALEKLQQKYQIPTFVLDLHDTEKLTQVVGEIKPKVVINCAEGDWDTEVYDAALANGSDVIDLGSDIPTTKRQLEMHEAFKEKNLVAL